jgi:very-short-patch-repair endonuclease
VTQRRTLQGIKSNLNLKRELRREMTLSEKILWLKLLTKEGGNPGRNFASPSSKRE